MTHTCERCRAIWECSEHAGASEGDHSRICLRCLQEYAATRGEQIVPVECRVCTARRWCQCPLGDEPYNLPCPNCGAEAMNAVAAEA